MQRKSLRQTYRDLVETDEESTRSRTTRKSKGAGYKAWSICKAALVDEIADLVFFCKGLDESRAAQVFTASTIQPFIEALLLKRTYEETDRGVASSHRRYSVAQLLADKGGRFCASQIPDDPSGKDVHLVNFALNDVLKALAWIEAFSPSEHDITDKRQ